MKRTAQAVVRRTLAQRSLRLPRIEPVDWVVGQRFTSNDDPDRTDPSKYAWEGPAFLKHTHPASQRQLTSLDELDVRGAGVRGCNAGRIPSFVLLRVMSDFDIARAAARI
eukprot:2477168-Rhodomonas_salina.1